MPGLEQLKAFSNDILNVGDEPAVRKEAGEKPITVPLPEGISEANDSADFEQGMKGFEKKEPQEAEDDGMEYLDSAEESENPDVSDLLDNLKDSGSVENPDLSEFEENADNAKDANDDSALDNLALDDILNDNTTSTTPTENIDEELPTLEEEGADDLQELDADNLQEDTDDLTKVVDTDPNPTGFDDGGSDVEPIDLNADLPEDLESDFEATQENAPKENEIDDTQDIPTDTSENIEEAPTTSPTPSPKEASPLTADIEPASSKENADDAVREMPETQQEMNASPKEMHDNTEEASGETKENADDNTDSFTMPDLNMDDMDFPSEKDSTQDAKDDLPSMEDIVKESESENGKDTSKDSESENDGALEESENEEPLEPLDSSNTSESEEEPPRENATEDTKDSKVPDEGFSIDDLNMDDIDLPKDIATSTDNQEALATEKAEAFNADELNSMDASDFEVGDITGGSADDSLDPNSFEIEGFTGEDAAPFDKNGKVKQAQKAGEESDSEAGIEKPRNSFTDAEYKIIKKNFLSYPLNVRLALEDFIVNDEFKDDVVFDVLNRVLHKATARQIAGQLEKLLDISINVPRNYERRTAEQYEEYKASFEYQIKNKIIPGVAAIAVLLFMVWGAFNLLKIFVYKPLMARKYYKQGYALIQDEAYPESRDCFNEAVRYRQSKPWFFKYANAYRDKKQYNMASDMYKNILLVFDHDKQAGLEYATMELYDRENYERAEEIVRRELLDYHVNDTDGILLLGDIFMEWAREKDPSKAEEANQQYSALIQVYGQTDLYMSRMLRYFVFMDNLREVLNLKNVFYPRKKALSCEDWALLSGYLLDKNYSVLKPKEEYLRESIEDVKSMLDYAISLDKNNTDANYNFAKYFVYANNTQASIRALEDTLNAYKIAKKMRSRDRLKYIDTYRMLGEQYTKNKEYIKAQDSYNNGIDLFEKQNKNTGFVGDDKVGKLYADMADQDYFISGDKDNALRNYQNATRYNNDTPSVRYRIGRIQYSTGNYEEALGSFIATAQEDPLDTHLLLALANTLCLRGDNYAASGYYQTLLELLDKSISRYGIILPQVRKDHGEIVDLYMKASNNLGVASHKIATQTGDSHYNALALVNMSESARAYDALSRNQETMVRLEGSNLATENVKYITSPITSYEPEIYVDIMDTLENEKILE